MKRILGFLLVSTAAAAQQYVISTVAGGGPPIPTPTSGLRCGRGSLGLVADGAGNIYFASSRLNTVLRLDPSGVVTPIAGNSSVSFAGDGGPATNARLNLRGALYSHHYGGPGGLAVDGEGNLFIADSGNHRIRRVSPEGIIATVAGTGEPGFSGDDGPAVSAKLNSPWGIAADRSGNIYVADNSNRVRKVSSSGIITTIAGNGSYGFSGDGGPATSAELNGAIGVALDLAGNLYVSDHSNNRIRKVSPSGMITTFAGDGTRGFSGDGGPAASAQLTRPWGVAVDNAGNLFIADYFNHRIRRVSSSGTITTVAGSGVPGFQGVSGDGGSATSADLRMPTFVAVDGRGNLLITDNDNERIREISLDGIISTIAGADTPSDFWGDGGIATSARLGIGPSYEPAFSSLAVNRAGDLFISDWGNNRVRRVSANGIITTVAGNGTPGSSGDGGRAVNAELTSPLGVAVDGSGSLFIACHDRVRKVSPNGTISTVVGGGTSGPGDGGQGTRAQLRAAIAVAVDDAGNLFIADSHRIRKLSSATGIITTVAGDGMFGNSGDGGPATSARLGSVAGLAVDAAGNVFLADHWHHRIRRVSTSGIITTVAGSDWGFSGDGGPAIDAQLSGPTSVAVDRAGNLFIATSFSYDGFPSTENNRIRKVSPSGIITTVAGTGAPGYSGDGGLATSAQLSSPAGLAVDSGGNVYISDTENRVVRVLRPTDRSTLISAVLDAASQNIGPISPGKMVVIYGSGLGPFPLMHNHLPGGQFGTELGGTVVSVNGLAVPILYTSATQVAAVLPDELAGTAAELTVTWQGRILGAIHSRCGPFRTGHFHLESDRRRPGCGHQRD